MMPIELSQIKDDTFVTRIDWRQGGSFSSKLFFKGLYIIHDNNLFHYYINIEEDERPYTIYDNAIELSGLGYF